jgi:hypothetical protein
MCSTVSRSKDCTRPSDAFTCKSGGRIAWRGLPRAPSNCMPPQTSRVRAPCPPARKSRFLSGRCLSANSKKSTSVDEAMLRKLCLPPRVTMTKSPAVSGTGGGLSSSSSRQRPPVTMWNTAQLRSMRTTHGARSSGRKYKVLRKRIPRRRSSNNGSRHDSTLRLIR